MNILIVFIILTITWLLAINRVRDRLSKGVIFCFLGYWSISLVLSTFNPSDLYDVSTSTYLLLLVHLFLFVVGFSLFSPKCFSVNTKAGLFNVDKICKSWLFWSLLLFVAAFGISLLITQRAVLAFYNTGNIKTDKLELLFQGSRLKYYLFDLLCTPFYYFSMALFSYLIFYIKNHHYTKIALFVLILIYSLIGGGRATILLIVFYLLLFYFSGERINNSNKEITPIRISSKSLIIGSLVVGILFIGMVYITYIGKHGLEGVDIKDFKETLVDFTNQILVYSLGPFRAFDYALHNPTLYFNSGYHFFRATFCGFDYLLSLVFGVLGFHFTPINYVTLSVMQDTEIMVGNGVGFNYAYTSVIYPYMDGGVLGVCFYGLVFGLLCRKIILMTYNKSSFYYLALLSFIFYMLMYTVFSNGLNKDNSILYIALLLFLAKNEKRRLV